MIIHYAKQVHNKIYNISGSIEDYHCYIKYREELNETNLICPQYYHENIELNIFIECININITKRIESINEIIISNPESYFSCQSCDKIEDNINHFECNKTHNYEINIFLSENDYNNITYYNYIDINTQKFYCSKNKKYIEDSSELIISDIQITNNFSLYDVYKYETNNIYTNIIDYIIETKRKELLNLFYRNDIDEGNDLEIYEENLIFTITNTNNQKNEKLNINKTTIYLNECEMKLKEGYNI